MLTSLARGRSKEIYLTSFSSRPRPVLDELVSKPNPQSPTLQILDEGVPFGLRLADFHRRVDPARPG